MIPDKTFKNSTCFPKPIVEQRKFEYIIHGKPLDEYKNLPDTVSYWHGIGNLQYKPPPPQLKEIFFPKKNPTHNESNTPTHDNTMFMLLSFLLVLVVLCKITN